MPKTKGTRAVTAHQMAKRICDRKDNVYDKRIIESIVDMYMEECRKALLDGERVLLTKVGTIVPEVKTHIGHYNMPTCNRFNENPPPYTRIRITHNWSMKQAMDRQLLNNIQNGIYGLKNLPFAPQQINILKNSGYIAEDNK